MELPKGTISVRNLAYLALVENRPNLQIKSRICEMRYVGNPRGVSSIQCFAVQGLCNDCAAFGKYPLALNGEIWFNTDIHPPDSV